MQITQCAPLWSSTTRDLGLDNDVSRSEHPIRLYVPGTEAYQRIERWASCDWAAKPPSRSIPVHGAPAPLPMGMGCPQPHSRAPNSILRLAVFLSSPHFFSAFNFPHPTFLQSAQTVTGAACDLPSCRFTFTHPTRDRDRDRFSARLAHSSPHSLTSKWAAPSSLRCPIVRQPRQPPLHRTLCICLYARPSYFTRSLRCPTITTFLRRSISPPSAIMVSKSSFSS